MLVFMLWQAWQQDYGPKPEVAAIVNPEVATAKEDLPIAAGTASQPETAAQNPVSLSAATASSAKTVKVEPQCFLCSLCTLMIDFFIRRVQRFNAALENI